MKKTYKYLLFISITALLSAAFLIRPAGDDWYTLCAPNFNFNWRYLLPQNVFWRPFDAITGGLVAIVPQLFPFINHVLAIGFYLTNAILVYEILCQLKVSKEVSSIACIFTLIGAGCMNALFSVDSFNQVGANAFGLLSVYSLLRKPNSRSWLLWCVFALFFKESGIVFFVITPLFYWLTKGGTLSFSISKKNFIMGVTILVGLILYFLMRKYLNQQVMAGVDLEKYSINISSNLIINTLMLLGASFTAIDTIALFVEKNWIVVTVSLLLSVPFLIVCGNIIFRSLKDKENRIRNLLLYALILVISSPHIVMGHAGELHIYPCYVSVILVMGYLFRYCSLNLRFVSIALILFAIVSYCVDWHKWYYIHEQGEKGHRLAERIYQKQEGKPEKVLLMMRQKVNKFYSVFLVSDYTAFGRGRAFQLLTNFEYPKIIYPVLVKSSQVTEELANQYIDEHDITPDCLWLVDNDSISIVPLSH